MGNWIEFRADGTGRWSFGAVRAFPAPPDAPPRETLSPKDKELFDRMAKPLVMRRVGTSSPGTSSPGTAPLVGTWRASASAGVQMCDRHRAVYGDGAPRARQVQRGRGARARSLAFAAMFASGALAWASTPADGSPVSRQLTDEGFRHAYELHFGDALATFAEARAADRRDPAPARAIASVTWMEILFAQGVATYHAFEGSASGESVSRPKVSAHLAERFARHADEALRLAEQGMAVAPDDADAQYQLAATAGLVALYRATVEGRTFAAFREGRRSVAIMDRVLRRDPAYAEAALIPGMYRYAVSTLSWPKRLVAGLAGLPADRDGGIRLIERAANESARTTADATLVLVVIYNREGRHVDALRHLERLRRTYPRNRLFALNAAATALAGSVPALAESTVTDVLAAKPSFDEPPVLGERAMWFYLRGAARVALGDPGAADDLRLSLSSEPRLWIRARTHLERCRLAARAGRHAEAQAECTAAIEHGERAADPHPVEAAKHLRRERQLHGPPGHSAR